MNTTVLINNTILALCTVTLTVLAVCCIYFISTATKEDWKITNKSIEEEQADKDKPKINIYKLILILLFSPILLAIFIGLFIIDFIFALARIQHWTINLFYKNVLKDYYSNSLFLLFQKQNNKRKIQKEKRIKKEKDKKKIAFFYLSFIFGFCFFAYIYFNLKSILKDFLHIYICLYMFLYLKSYFFILIYYNTI